MFMCAYTYIFKHMYIYIDIYIYIYIYMYRYMCVCVNLSLFFRAVAVAVTGCCGCCVLWLWWRREETNRTMWGVLDDSWWRIYIYMCVCRNICSWTCCWKCRYGLLCMLCVVVVVEEGGWQTEPCGVSLMFMMTHVYVYVHVTCTCTCTCKCKCKCICKSLRSVILKVVWVRTWKMVNEVWEGQRSWRYWRSDRPLCLEKGAKTNRTM